MKIAGFVAEFNPFHKGHEYLINKIKEEGADVIVVAMSPNFVMRGEPAIFNKIERTTHALNSGIDIVLEIPTVYAIQSADIYALSGVTLLEKAGVTDLYFGVENDNLPLFLEIRDALLSDKYRELLQKYQKEGNGFSISSKKALSEINPEFEEILSSPNNLLGIEYLVALKKTTSNIVPHLIKRVDSGYYDGINESSLIQSATALREELSKDSPNESYFPYEINNLQKHVKEDYLDLLKYRVSSTSSFDLSKILGMNEGFENRLKTKANWNSYDSLVESLISKRDRETKVKRILTAVLLGIKKDEGSIVDINYIRVLGFSTNGSAYLKTIKNSNIISRIKRDLPKELYRELDFTKIYSIPHNEELVLKEYEPIKKR